MGGFELLIVLGPFLVAVAVGLLVARSRRKRAVQDPCCGQCGYQVRGLTTFTCPECGSDLREVGIRTAGSHAPLSPGLKALIWTVLLPFPAILLSGFIAAMIPSLQSIQQSFTLSDPGSGLYRQFSITGTGEAYGRTPGLQRLSINLIPLPAGNQASTTGPLVVYTEKMGFEYRRPNGEIAQAESGLNEGVILKWMAGAGIDTASEKVNTEVAELFARIQAGTAPGAGFISMPGGAFGGYASVGNSISVGSPRWLAPVLLIFWAGVWLAGLARIFFPPKGRPGGGQPQSPLV